MTRGHWIYDEHNVLKRIELRIGTICQLRHGLFNTARAERGVTDKHAMKRGELVEIVGFTTKRRIRIKTTDGRARYCRVSALRYVAGKAA